MFNIGQNYEKLWRAIIRPPRAEYKIQDLGPKLFKKRGLKIQRTDIELLNKQGLKLQCSHYQPYNRPRKELPCVIYLHGNSSCRLQGYNCIKSILTHDVTLFTFDFAGCGISEGQYISLGYYERDDVQTVFEHLRKLGTVSSIGIWGRSMGAVTALMYADTNPQIACVVLDSPFSNLTDLCKQLADKFANSFSIFSGIALKIVSSTIKQKHNFDIEKIDPLKHVKKAYIPALFIAGREDQFILPKHSQILHKAYSGQKDLIIVQGDHNSKREQCVYERISTFFFYGLMVKDLCKPDPQYLKQQQINKKQLNKQQKHEVKANIEFQEIFQNNYNSYDHNLEQQQQLRKAIEESLKISQANNNQNQKAK